MSNVMVCVTQQKTCDRLIERGSLLTGSKKDELFVIHVTPKSFGAMSSSEEGAALDYLYEKAMEYGASLTVVRSEDILKTLLDLVDKHRIETVVLGETGNVSSSEGLIKEFEDKVSGRAEVVIVPSGTGN
ncbi:MAG: universal stress protein UspA [Bacillota bacterium]|nr:universal stress protein UspA [Bacillota bacterium]